jgi:hypothetical protein
MLRLSRVLLGIYILNSTSSDLRGARAGRKGQSNESFEYLQLPQYYRRYSAMLHTVVSSRIDQELESNIIKLLQFR